MGRMTGGMSKSSLRLYGMYVKRMSSVSAANCEEQQVEFRAGGRDQ